MDVLDHGDAGRVSVFGDEGGAYLRSQHGGVAVKRLLTQFVQPKMVFAGDSAKLLHWDSKELNLLLGKVRVFSMQPMWCLKGQSI